MLSDITAFSRENNFVHLHTHSDFSPTDSAMSVEDIARRAKELGMSAVAVTDHGKAGGLLQLKKACAQEGIKPIYGIELYCSPTSRLNKDRDTYRDKNYDTSYHMTILAKNPEGLKNIFRLASIGWLEGFYYRPRVDMETIEKYSEGLVALSGCGASFLSKMIMQSRLEEAYAHHDKCKKIFGEDYYIEVQNHGLAWQGPLKDALFVLSRETGVPAVITQDAHFIDHDDFRLHQKICKLAAGDLEFDTTETYFKSYQEMKKRFEPDEYHALDRTVEIADKCNVEWNFGKPIWPVYELPDKITPQEELTRLSTEGFKKLFGEGTLVYRERLEYELSVIDKMDFATYFLVVADFIKYSRANGIRVGAGRGSGAGSLVCYCMGITQVDPIEYNLYFERFLNPDRISLPDLDLDFSPRGRKAVIEYVSQKYGADRVAQIGTYSQFKPRGSLRDFSRACGYPVSVGALLAALIPPDVAGKQLTFDEALKAEPKLSKTEYQDVVDLAIKAEGIRTKAGVHAAGVVISDRPLMEQVPLFRGRNDEIATQFDMYDIEEYGLVKLDFLGLINLDIISDTIDCIKQYRGIEIDIDLIDKTDQEVYKNIFHTGNLDGVFQFETSSGFKELCVRVKPETIKDLSCITSIFRPGPLATGITDKYVAGRNGSEVEYLIPELEPILKDTYGSMIFQEQIMKICTDLAGYTAAEADDMRKAIGKKIAEKMASHRDKFIDGCVKNNIDRGKATQLWDDIDGFSKYSFNASHAVAYSFISYQTAWLKYYYPIEFYCALFNNTTKEQAQLVKYIHSCRAMGISIEPPDVNRSGSLFTIDHDTIMFGLSGIKGIGEKACELLIQERPEEGFVDLNALIGSGVNSNVIRALAQAGALTPISELSSVELAKNLDSIVKHYKLVERYTDRRERYIEREAEIQTAKEAGRKPPRKLPKLPELPQCPEIVRIESGSKQARLKMERETLGFYLTGHPLDSYPCLTRISATTIEKIIDEGTAGEIVRVAGVVSQLSKKRTRKGTDMANILLEDRTGRLDATIFPKTWKKVCDKLTEDIVIIATCRVEREQMEEDMSLTRLIMLDLENVDDNIMLAPEPTNITINTTSGSTITFIIPSDVNVERWQRAMAIAKNLETR